MGAQVRIVIAAFLVALATIGGTLSMQGLVETSSWLGAALLSLGVTAVVVALVRLWSSSPWLPTAVGAVAGAYVTVTVFAPGRGMFAPLPDLSSAGEILGLAQQGVQDAATTRPPVLGSDGLALWIVAAVVLVFLLAELLAVGCRAPAWSGLALLAPWAPAVALGEHVPAPVFVLSAIGYLGLLILHAARAVEPGPQDGHGAAWASASGVAASAVVVALVAAPAVLALPTPTWQGSGAGGSGATRLDLGLDVSEHLVRGADELLYSYRASDPDEVGPLHAYTMTEFTGSQWLQRPEPDGTEPVAPEKVLWPDAIEPGRPDQSLQMHVLELAQDRLLLPDQPRRLSIEGEWGYHDAADEVIGSGPTPLEYEVEIFEVDIDPVALNAAGPADPDEVDPLTLDVPDTGHQAQIQALAQRVVDAAGAQTPYEQAVAIQDFLRHDSQFTYDVRVDPAHTSDAVWDFLGSGRGYCVQFATAMVMMARTLDLPARMAVGFLEGEENDEGAIEVSGHRAHTWPQLFFDGVGWVRFEPTPPTRTGSPPDWAAGVPEDLSAGENEEIPTATAAPREPEPDSDDAGPQTVPEPRQSEADDASRWAWLTLAVPLTLALLALAWRRRRERTADVERSWAQVRRAAATVRPEQAHPGETPRGLHARLGLSGAAAGALVDLVRAVERHRYARPGQHGPSGADLRRWRDQVLAAIRERTSTGRRVRRR